MPALCLHACLHAYVGLLANVSLCLHDACKRWRDYVCIRRWPAYVCMQLKLLACLCLHADASLLMSTRIRWFANVCMQMLAAYAFECPHA